MVEILFRTGGNRAIGLGHLLRCIALAEAFEERGAKCHFAGEVPTFLSGRVPGGDPLAVPGGIEDWRDARFAAAAARSDLLVTDLYAIQAEWQRRSPAPVLAIADPPLADLHCDLLVLPTAFTPPGGRDALTAPRHSLIRAEVRARRGAPKLGTKVLVNCGGGDDRGLTGRILRAMNSEPALRNLATTVVTGLLDEGAEDEIQSLVLDLPLATLRTRVADMAALTAGHDIAIGTPAGGALERCCLGLAQIVIPIADNQVTLARDLAGAGALVALPPDASRGQIAAALRDLVDDPKQRATFAEAGFRLIDGTGAERVADAAYAMLGSA